MSDTTGHDVEALKDLDGRVYGYGCATCGQQFTYAPTVPSRRERAAVTAAVEAAAKAHAVRAREFLTEVAATPHVYDEMSGAPYQQWAGYRLGVAIALVGILADTIDQLTDEHDQQDDNRERNR